jgi:tellurite resistance protein
VACADGIIEAQEQEQLHAIARALGINEGVVQLEINAFERAHHQGKT